MALESKENEARKLILASGETLPEDDGGDLKDIKTNEHNCGNIDDDNNDDDDENGELLSLETLRESPVEWPEKLPGMTDFLTMSDTPIHMPNVEHNQDLTPEEQQEVLELSSLNPDELVAKIKALHDEVFQLGSREAKEMTRGKLLGIFSRLGRKK